MHKKRRRCWLTLKRKLQKPQKLQPLKQRPKQQQKLLRKQRWSRPESLAAARRYNQLARDNGMTPTEMALAFCYHRWSVASTIIGVTSVAQLDEDLAAWSVQLSPEVLKAIDQIRWEIRDPSL